MFVSALPHVEATGLVITGVVRSRHNGGPKSYLIFLVLHFKSDFHAFAHTLGRCTEFTVFGVNDETLSVQDVVRFLFK